MVISSEIVDKIYKSISKAEKILIISHRNPDPDTIGSNLALRIFLEKLGKKVKSACIDEVSKDYNQISSTDLFDNNFNLADFDLFISVDCGSIDQIGFPNSNKKYAKLTNEKIPLINIDHHPSNNNFGTINLVINDSASTTLIIFHLLCYWKEKITPKVATLLLFGLYYDTGSFSHSNTDNLVFDVAAKLLSLGARNDLIVKCLFKTHSINKLRLWGEVLNNTTITNNNIAFSGVTKKDFDKHNCTHGDLSGVIDYLSSAKGNNFTTLLSCENDEVIKGSLRTRKNNTDVAKIAKKFGGGGHNKASGFSIKGKLFKSHKVSIIQK